MPIGELGHLLRRPSILLVGLVANLLVPVAYILGVAQMMRLWHDPAEMHSVLIGLALIASMPIAGSATAWSRKADGNLALSLGPVLVSTLLSPLTTPLVLYAIGLLTVGGSAADLQDLAGHGTGIFLFLCVLVPSVLGILTPRVLGERRIAPARPFLKPVNAALLLMLLYINASVSFPALLTQFAPDFLGAMVGIAVSFCVVAFAAGWLVARLLRAEPGEQRALMFGLGMNNNGAGMVLASAVLAVRPQVLLLIVCYNLVQHLVAGGVDFIWVRQPIPAAPGAEPPEDRLPWRLALRPLLSFSFMLLAGVVLANACASYWNIRTIAGTNDWVVHTHEALTQVQDTLSLLKDAETGQRGYLITGDPRYLEPYETATGHIHERFKRLKELTGDNPSQKARTNALEGMIVERLGELNLTIRLRKEKGFEAAREIVLVDSGKQQMDDIRRLMADMEAEEQRLLEERTAESDTRVRRALATVVLLTCGVLIYSFLRRLVAEQPRKQKTFQPRGAKEWQGEESVPGGRTGVANHVQGERLADLPDLRHRGDPCRDQLDLSSAWVRHLE